MRTSMLVACLCVTMGGIAGCGPAKQQAASAPAAPRDSAGPPRSAGADERRIALLESELTDAKTQNDVLTSQIEEQGAREKRLSDEVNRLRFVNTQLENQVRALASAPIDRDLYKKRCDELTAEVNSLRQRLGLPPLRLPASAPAELPPTAPAAE